MSLQLEEKFKESVSVETVRKWFAGEAKPRPEKLQKLAELLEVDVAWLSLGVDPTLQLQQRSEKKIVNGPLNLVAGLIQLDGGSIAFPEASDQVARKNHVNLRAVIKGAKYDFHVTTGEIDGRKLKFVVPDISEAVIVLGLVKKGFSVEMFELTPELIADGTRRNGSIDLLIDKARIERRKIESFKTRL